MKVIYGPRNSGRTTELINRSHETGKYILVGSKREARQVFDFARSLDKSIPYPVTVAEVQRRCHPEVLRLREGILIDNLEWVLYVFMGLEVDTVVVEAAERVEPKKYYLKHKYLDRPAWAYLNYHYANRKLCLMNRMGGHAFKTQFTDSEIEEIEATGFDLRNFERVEVEDE